MKNMEMNFQDKESLENKLRRMMDVHNGLTSEFFAFRGQMTLVIDTLMSVLQTIVPNFEEEYKAESLRLRIDQTVEARVRAHTRNDLEAYAVFGKNLEVLKHEAKEMDRLSLYHKTVRRAVKRLETDEYRERAKDMDLNKIVDLPTIVDDDR